MNRQMEEVKGNQAYWKPVAKEDQISGVITKINKEGKFGIQFCIDDERQGEVWTPSHKVIQNRLEGSKVGEYVQIVFLGTELPSIKGNNPTSLYRVMREKKK